MKPTLSTFVLSHCQKKIILHQDEYHRKLRRTIMRQVNLSSILVFRRVAPKVLARFPTYRSLVDAGLMLPQEADNLAELDCK